MNSIVDLQKMFDAFGAGMRDVRSDYHLTLGAAIKKLSGISPDCIVSFDVGGHPTNPHSYRGYYSDLAFESAETPATAAQFLEDCKQSLGATFGGYKGGDFVMGEKTPLWAASYGCCGRAIIALTESNGAALLITKEDEP